jgi:hypothetical protein
MFPRVGRYLLNTDTVLAAPARPSAFRRVARGLKRRLERVDGGILPPFLRGTSAHKALRRLKFTILGYRFK